ncbi:MAG: hypothetical protein IAB80_03075 [Bacteroidetes bacterium]|uniref:Uncharacterized protein n=1 Tax=Candidatus Cryptobacteroides excrementipullorum TaxID=2840761 RepID=A0A9D9IS79_9BACT|nr:hypothetical protein [Candidatus Cryptobacteroides excrementipullorum]
MKKKLLIIGLCISCIVCVSSLKAGGVETGSERNSEKNLSAALPRQFESGKWVAEYGNGSAPFRCVCVKDFFKSQCRVGDTSTKMSLCE